MSESVDERPVGGNRVGQQREIDRQIGRLLGFLESRGLLENTLLVVVADHGESLGEHGIRFRHVYLGRRPTFVFRRVPKPVNRPVAVLVDGKIASAPTVRSTIGNEAMLTGAPDVVERMLALLKR